MQDGFKTEIDSLNDKANKEEGKMKEDNDTKKITAGQLRRTMGILKEREDQYKELERKYNLKLVDLEEIKTELSTESLKVQKLQQQLEELKVKQKMLTGKDFVFYLKNYRKRMINQSKLCQILLLTTQNLRDLICPKT